MLDISESIQLLNDKDISDNLLHYDYNTKHLLSLIDKGMDRDDPSFMSSYRSFEGEVFENFVYEKLLRYAEKSPDIDKFPVLVSGGESRRGDICVHRFRCPMMGPFLETCIHRF